MLRNRNKLNFFSIFIALFLASCESKEESKNRNERLLPDGCRIIDMDYGNLTAAVICDKRKSTTQLKEWSETIMQAQYDGKGQFTGMLPITYYYSNITATIEAE